MDVIYGSPLIKILLFLILIIFICISLTEEVVLGEKEVVSRGWECGHLDALHPLATTSVCVRVFLKGKLINCGFVVLIHTS